MIANNPTNRFDVLGLLDGGDSNTMMGLQVPDLPIDTRMPENVRCECEKLKDLLRWAMIAGASYPDWTGGLPQGWSRQGNIINDEKSGFNATIFSNPDQHAIAVAFRGTENSSLTTIMNDWTTNITEPFGVSKGYAQLNQAADLTADVQRQYQGWNITLVGHSEAGAEAASGSMASGLPAVTFNPLGVSYPAAIRMRVNPFSHFLGGRGNITGAYVDGEILTTLEDRNPGQIPSFDGNLLKLQPAGRQAYFMDDPRYRIQLHGMDEVVRALKKRMNDLGCK
jgi:hypothetical protein